MFCCCGSSDREIYAPLQPEKVDGPPLVTKSKAKTQQTGQATLPLMPPSPGAVGYGTGLRVPSAKAVRDNLNQNNDTPLDLAIKWGQNQDPSHTFGNTKNPPGRTCLKRCRGVLLQTPGHC